MSRSQRAALPGSVHTGLIALLLTILLLTSGCAVLGSEQDRDGPRSSPSAVPSAFGGGGKSAAAAIANPVAAVLTAVVEVRAVSATDASESLTAIGTGILYDRRGVIVTADHVLSLDGAIVQPEITVILSDGRSQPARIVARFPGRDIAFIATEPYGGTPARFVHSYDELREGNRVFAVGAPQEFSRPVAAGRILAVRTDLRIPRLPTLTAILETSAQLHRGYSGGPLVDTAGRVVAMNIAVSPGPPGPRTTGFAVPAPLVVETAKQALATARR